jgi:hypothetical protein
MYQANRGAEARFIARRDSSIASRSFLQVGRGDPNERIDEPSGPAKCG